MPLPNDVPLVTINGDIRNPVTGNPAVGAVTFSNPSMLRDSVSNVLLGTTVYRVPLVSGLFTVALPATDYSGISPQNWVWTAEVATDAGSDLFQFSLPSTPATVSFSSLVPVTTPPTVLQYIPITQKGVANGIATLGSDGILSVAQRPAAGAGTVTSVSNVDGTIVVTGTPTVAPVVSVGTIAESQVANLSTDLAAKVPITRTITAGTGLTGGGDLTANRTLTVSYGTTAGTSAQGNDSRVTGAVQASTATAKGDLLVATAASTVTREGVGTDGQILMADSTQTTGVKWGSINAGTVFPLSGYGLLTASDEPAFFQNPSPLSNGTVFGARCWVPANTALSTLTAAVRTGGTYSASAVPNQLGIYDDTGAQLQVTVNDNTLWTTAGWASRSITTVAAQTAGRFVYILYILGGFTGVVVPYALGANDSDAPWLAFGVSNAGNKRCFYLNGQTALPASFNPATVGTSTGFIPLVGAY